MTLPQLKFILYIQVPSPIPVLVPKRITPRERPKPKPVPVPDLIEQAYLKRHPWGPLREGMNLALRDEFRAGWKACMDSMKIRDARADAQLARDLADNFG
jgi:hypothetical protein